MITWKITRSCINNNMDFGLKSLLLRPFYISYNTCISIYIDSGNVFSLFLDFRKAFDRVNHEILLSMLNTCGVWGIALFTGSTHINVTSREQYVSINNVDSNPRFIQCGVPQGSILGPLLFIIFINDITRCSNKFKYILYEDHSTL